MTYSAQLVSISVILAFMVNIQVARSTIPVFMIPLFIAPYVLGLKYVFITAFVSHFLVDLLVYGSAFGTSIFWELGTMLVSLSLYLISNIKKNSKVFDILKLFILMLSNVIIYSLVGLIDYLLTENYLVIWQVITGIFIVNNISYVLFYFMLKKVNKVLSNKFFKQKEGFIMKKENKSNIKIKDIKIRKCYKYKIECIFDRYCS